MRTKSFVYVGLLMLLPIIFAGCGQRKVVLQQEIDLTGFVFTETTTTTMDNIELIYEQEDQVMTTNMTAVTRQIIEEEILSPNRSRVHIIKDIAETDVDLEQGTPESQKEKGVLHDKLLVAERIGLEWEYSLKEGEPTENQQAKLDELARNKEYENIIYPEEMVTVGQHWDIEPETISRMFGVEQVLHSTGEGTMQFQEITMYDGYECALLTLNMTVSAEIIDDELGRSQMNLEVEGKVYRSLELFRDIGTKLKGVINIRSEDEETGMAVTMQGPVLIESHVAVTDIEPS